MIRYLAQEEKLRTRLMYETNFPEDGKKFVDYYYDWKLRDNQILVMEEQEQKTSQLQVMIHLNPYEFQMSGELVKVNYIVAVATDASVRKQGKMAEVMKYALQDMAKKHQPFAFLIPANPRVYVSSGFSHVPSEKYEEYRSLLVAKQQAELCVAELAVDIVLQKAKAEDIPEITAFSNGLLEKEYDIFPHRTEEYYERMLSELKSENGALMLLKQNGKLVGSFSYGKEENRVELQEILAEPDYRDILVSLTADYFRDRQINVTEMNYMVRILDLRTLGLLLRSEEPFSLKVQVRGDVIAANNGCFEIKADAAGSSIAVIEAEETECSMDIAQLAQFLFGKVKLFVREWV